MLGKIISAETYNFVIIFKIYSFKENFPIPEHLTHRFWNTNTPYLDIILNIQSLKQSKNLNIFIKMTYFVFI